MTILAKKFLGMGLELTNSHVWPHKLLEHLNQNDQ